jgi:hypothetical protein
MAEEEEQSTTAKERMDGGPFMRQSQLATQKYITLHPGIFFGQCSPARPRAQPNVPLGPESWGLSF